VALLSAGGVAGAHAGDKRVSAVTSETARFARFVSEAALRFGIPTSWITAVMQAESRGVVRAVSPKGAMGLMQIMPDTWSGLRSRYRLGADPFDPHDNILAGAAYLRELHDRYGELGFLAAYNAGPGRYEDHLATGRPLPAETRAYVAALTPSLHDGGSAPGNFITAIIRSWMDAPLFPVRRNEGSTISPRSSDGVSQRRPTATSAADWTGLAPQSEGLFARLSIPQAMSCVLSDRGVADKRTRLDVRAGERRRPTHRRQGKRPALGAAHVVGKVEKFTNGTNTGCWRFLQIVQAFQGFERRRSDLRPGTPP